VQELLQNILEYHSLHSKDIFYHRASYRNKFAKCILCRRRDFHVCRCLPTPRILWCDSCLYRAFAKQKPMADFHIRYMLIASVLGRDCAEYLMRIISFRPRLVETR
jgi:hypothetical protein